MWASEVMADWPAGPGPDREAAILEAFAAGLYVEPTWVPIETSWTEYTARFWVSTDALRVGELADAVRVNTTQPTATWLGDMFGAVSPTRLLSDQIWKQADVHLAPVVLGKSPLMASTAWMVEHSKLLDHRLAGHPLGWSDLIADVGKDWIATWRLWWPEQNRQRAANWGWRHPDGHPIQGMGIDNQGILFHGQGHTDYSQTNRLLLRKVLLIGPHGAKEVDIQDLALDPQLWRLVSDEGQVVLRHPAVPCPPVAEAGWTIHCVDQPPPRPGRPGPGMIARVLPLVVIGAIGVGIGVFA